MEHARRIRRGVTGWWVGVVGLACGSPAPVEVPDPGDESEPPASVTPYAFVDVSVLTMDAPGVTAEQTVLVRGERIEAMGPVASVTVPADAIRIEGQGRYLMPGLADMHIHMATSHQTLLYVANGVTTVREMWGGPVQVAVRDSIAAKSLVGPRMIVGSPGIRGTNWMPRNVVMTDPSIADSVVRAFRAAGYDFIKVHDDVPGDSYAAVLRVAGSLGMEVAGHAPWPAGLDAVLATAQTSVEHISNAFLPLVRAEGNSSGWYNSALDHAGSRTVGERLRDAGMWNTPTLATLRAILTPAEESTFQTRPEARYIFPPTLAAWRSAGTWIAPSVKDATTEAWLTMTKIFFDAGVRLLVGTDGGFTFVLPGYSIHDELELFVEAGLTPEQTLRIATRDAAEFLGRLEDLGMVAVGRIADLVLLEANPFDAIGNVRWRAGVMLRGRWFTETDLQQRLEDLAQSF